MASGSSMTESPGRNFTITPTDHGGIALILSTLMCTWAIMCFMVRVYMRFTASGPFGADDFVIGLATVFGVAQMITSCIAVVDGFGKYTTLLTPMQIVSAEKAVYAAQLLYIVTNCLTKSAVALLLARIVFIKNRVHACYVVLLISGLWGLGSLLAQAIRCTEYPPWQLVDGACPNNVVSWKAITAFNVFIETLLFALPIWLVWSLQTDAKRKAAVVCLFMLRLPVIPAAILRIHYLSRADNSAQPLFEGVIPFVCMVVEMHYGLMSATMPTLKPFVSSFNTGWGTYDTSAVMGYDSNGYMSNNTQSYAMMSLERRTGGFSGGGSRTSRGRGSALDRSVDRDDGLDSRLGFMQSVARARARPDHERTVTGSSDSSKRMIIHQTTTCEVRYDHEIDPEGSR